MKTRSARRKTRRQFLPYVRVTLVLGFEGRGINGNTTEDPERLLRLLAPGLTQGLVLGRHCNNRDSVKLKDAEVASLQVCKRTRRGS